MTLYSMLGLSLAMLVLAASPGPGVFITVASAMASGFRSALAVIAGIVIGDLIFLLLAILGLSFVARTLGELFVLVKLCGGVYLIWLGVKTWRTGSTGKQSHRLSKGPTVASSFISGLLITLSNPKVILFYCGFLPTFIDLTGLAAMDIMMIAALICVILATVLTVYAFLASQARRAFSRPGTLRGLHRTAAGILMVTGISMIAYMRR